jgi:hypothetical protein
MGWTLYNSNCYKFDVAYELSWSACESECSDLSASMLCIPDYATNTWISEQLIQSNSNYGYNYYNTWIGYSDLPNEDGAYHWSSGCSSTFTNIASSYNYDCFYLDSYEGVWYSQEDAVDYSISCSCEYALVPTLAPTEAPISSPTILPTSLEPMISPSILPTSLSSPSLTPVISPSTLPTPPSYAPSVAESQQDSSVAYAIIIGVVVGAVAFCILFGLTLYYFFSRGHNNNKNKLAQVELSDIYNTPVTDNVREERNEENESSNPMIHDEGPMKNAPDGVDVSTTRVKKDNKNQTTRVKKDNRNQYMDLESLD